MCLGPYPRKTTLAGVMGRIMMVSANIKKEKKRTSILVLEKEPAAFCRQKQADRENEGTGKIHSFAKAQFEQ